MFKITLKQWGVSLGANLVLSIVLAIVGFILEIFSASGKVVMLVTIVLTTIVMIFFLFVLWYCMSELKDFVSYFIIGEEEYFIADPQTDKKPPEKPSLFFTKLKNRQKVKSWRVHVSILPLLILAVTTAILLYTNNQELSELMTASRADDDAVLKYMYYIVLLSCTPICQFFFWLRFTIEWSKRTCRKCHCVMSMVYAETLDVKSGDYTDHKTKDVTEKIGEIYANHHKVASVYGKTGTVKYERTMHWSSSDTRCKCLYCSKEKVVHEEDAFLSDWK